MSSSSCASIELSLPPRRRRRSAPEARRLAGGFVEGVFGLCLLASVVGVLALRYARVIAIAEDEQTAQWQQDRLYGTFDCPIVSRAGFQCESPYWTPFLYRAVPQAERDWVVESLPEGEHSTVWVRGALADQSDNPHYGPLTGRHVAYLFEACYRRAIERNDGHTIVERRTYQNVRFAKIVAPVRMAVELDACDPSRLDGLAFPEPGAGIVVAPVDRVAGAVLGDGAKAVLDCPASRAFLEQDLLSGKSVRLTYVDGVGVTSVEPLGWEMTKPIAAELFNTAVLPPRVRPADSAGETGRETHVPQASLIALLDPSQFLPACPEPTYVVRPAAKRGGAGMDFELLVENDGCDGMDTPLDGSPGFAASIGRLHYREGSDRLESASVRWPACLVTRTDDRLLFEDDFPESATLNVQYRCRID